ncbi:colanic acid biosynthesis glycosyltransferase WcaL [Moorena producens PAL-8-15-08-1]|uniref:Colanic acid biosynthesis glycosyltransferase WcaL n=1 Tax=Moorena producens PAL-8-15-08-1 TaxID=1458985 RepID=A0A1D8TVP1_9CYAN|nr:glycosyltransferase family 4 protein [Moorena producens]AOX01603.1 colanic acid biosynthesis glycosyltransferase WcaL [Moorena producens PAL-8-15-08-1]
MTIAYLVNQYPKVSHSFIRREIAGVEACGIQVKRFSIRSCASQLVDPADQLELQKTRFVLGVGIVGLCFSLLRTALTRPIRLLKTLGLTLKIGWGSDRGVLNHLAYLAEACVLLGWFSESDIERVHAHFGTNSTTVAMLCHALGGPSYSFTVHGPEEFDKSQLLALREKINRAAFVVAVSSFGKSQLYRWCSHNQWSKIHVIHCGVDQMFLSKPHTPIPDVPRLVCVGRLSEQKGHLLLIQAAHQLAAEGLQFKLVLVGDGPLRSEIEGTIAQLGLQDHIEITGWASNTEVQQQILAARALVLPSFAEGLPVVLMEALALGRPVITTYVAGIPELVSDGSCGWLVPPGSVEALTAAMAEALNSPVETLEEMGKAGAERVARRHDVATEAKKLSAVFLSNPELPPKQAPIEAAPTSTKLSRI